MKDDAEEIKRHLWFKETNWVDVYHKRLTVITLLGNSLYLIGSEYKFNSYMVTTFTSDDILYDLTDFNNILIFTTFCANILTIPRAKL